MLICPGGSEIATSGCAVRTSPRHFVSSLPCPKKAKAVNAQCTSWNAQNHRCGFCLMRCSILNAVPACPTDLELSHPGEVSRRRYKIWRKRLRVPLTMCGRMWENSTDLGIMKWTLCVYILPAYRCSLYIYIHAGFTLLYWNEVLMVCFIFFTFDCC